MSSIELMSTIGGSVLLFIFLSIVVGGWYCGSRDREWLGLD